MQGPLGNSTITTITWEVPITPGRTDTVTGTVEDVIRHLEAVAPEILPEASITSVPGLEPASVPTPFDGALAKRATPSNVLCDELLTYAGREAIKDGYYHLMGLDGSPENGPVSHTSLPPRPPPRPPPAARPLQDYGVGQPKSNPVC